MQCSCKQDEPDDAELTLGGMAATAFIKPAQSSAHMNGIGAQAGACMHVSSTASTPPIKGYNR
jgi:hypothetical protein